MANARPQRSRRLVRPCVSVHGAIHLALYAIFDNQRELEDKDLHRAIVFSGIHFSRLGRLAR
jgi:hypothetical protein